MSLGRYVFSMTALEPRLRAAGSSLRDLKAVWRCRKPGHRAGSSLRLGSFWTIQRCHIRGELSLTLPVAGRYPAVRSSGNPRGRRPGSVALVPPHRGYTTPFTSCLLGAAMSGHRLWAISSLMAVVAVSLLGCQGFIWEHLLPMCPVYRLRKVVAHAARALSGMG